MTTLSMHAKQANEVLHLITGYWISQAVYAAAKLGVADLVALGPSSVDALAKKIGAHGEALYRLMRALASVGIFTETEPNNFGMTPKAELLRSDHPLSLRPVALLCGDLQYTAWEDIVYSVKTGGCAYEHRTGVPFFDFLERNAQAAQTFNAAMTSFLQSIPRSLVEVYDFSECSKVVDVGGAQGTLISTILRTYPKLRGVLFDLPNVVESAKQSGEVVAVASRCDFVGGNFFESIPGGGDIYILSTIIHDWDDERSLAILKNCRNAIAPTGKLLLVEMVIQPGNEPFFGKWLDLHMLVMHGGRDRTEAEYRRLLDAAGFEIKRIIPTGFLRSVIEAAPR